MQKTLFAIAVALLPASAALAEQPGSKPDQFTPSGKLLPVKEPGTGNSCAAYGPGFIKVEGTGTCVKIGGAVRIDAGSSVGSH
jgi:porin-like protein